MSFRGRLLIIFLAVVLIPMAALVFFVRGEMTGRITAQYERRVASLVEVIEDDLDQERTRIDASIDALCDDILNDNRFRRAAVDRVESERRYLLDYAGNAMRLSGLSMLQIQDDDGRIISSGHFRNEYDRMDPILPRLLATTPEGTALIRVRAPDAPFIALACIDSVQMGSKRFTIIAGIKIEERFLVRLAREGDLVVDLDYPGVTNAAAQDSLPGDTVADTLVRVVRIPFIDPAHDGLDEAVFRVSHDLTDLNSLRHSIDRWFLIAVGITAFLAVILVAWTASRISRPLAGLAEKTARVDLDRLDVDFTSKRKDEIGTLTRVLGAMTSRLRASATHIKDAERRATLGEMARQVNHDIKNGLTPIRNVFRHLTQMASEDPSGMSGVFKDRKETIDSSISYLETLATNYARLSPRSERRPCDVNDIARNVVASFKGPDDTIELEIKPGDLGGGAVLGDPLSLRRVFENVIDNALGSLGGESGRVVVSTTRVVHEGDDLIRVTVNDTGSGMTPDQVSRIFDDFYTTKDKGTGLGLSIVRRLVMDLGGTIDVTSEVGRGSRFQIDLPVAGN